MRNHDIYRRNLKRQHHDVTPALAFDHALLAGQGPVLRLRRQLSLGDDMFVVSVWHRLGHKVPADVASPLRKY